MSDDLEEIKRTYRQQIDFMAQQIMDLQQAQQQSPQAPTGRRHKEATD